MNLNIKNERTCTLIRELSKLTGESITEALTQAVRERLDRIRHEDSTLAVRLLAIGKDCASRLKAVSSSINCDELLYGEDGLPN